nr:acetyltransferase [Clostridium sp.]
MEKFVGKNSSLKDIVIVGAGGFGREVAWLIEEINRKDLQWNIIGFIDDDLSKKDILLNGYEVLGDLTYIQNKEDLYFACAVANSKNKAKLAKKCESIGLKPATLIHPNAEIGSCSNIGAGNIICAGNIITVNVKTGKYVIVTSACTIGHDSILQNYITIYPGVSVSGNCNIGEKVEIGTRSSIIQGMNIGKETILGAGSVVIKDIPEYCTAVGVPAKPIKFLNMEE